MDLIWLKVLRNSSTVLYLFNTTIVLYKICAHNFLNILFEIKGKWSRSISIAQTESPGWPPCWRWGGPGWCTAWWRWRGRASAAGRVWRRLAARPLRSALVFGNSARHWRLGKLERLQFSAVPVWPFPSPLLLCCVPLAAPWPRPSPSAL